MEGTAFAEVRAAGDLDEGHAQRRKRPAETRIKEVLALPGVECLVIACPKDLVMFQDAVKTVGAEGRLRVADLGELVHEALAVSLETPDEGGVPLSRPQRRRTVGFVRHNHQTTRTLLIGDEKT